MNRALGAGVVAGSAAAILIGTPQPASAHGFILESSLGYVQMFSDHGSILVWDNTGDSQYTRGDVTLESGAKAGVIAGPSGPLNQWWAPPSNPIVAVRKCHRPISSSSWNCGDWVGA